MHFVHCNRVPQQGRSLCSSFVLYFPLIVPTKVSHLNTCLWNPGTYRHKIARLSSAVWPRNVSFAKRKTRQYDDFN